MRLGESQSGKRVGSDTGGRRGWDEGGLKESGCRGLLRRV